MVTHLHVYTKIGNSFADLLPAAITEEKDTLKSSPKLHKKGFFSQFFIRKEEFPHPKFQPIRKNISSPNFQSKTKDFETYFPRSCLPMFIKSATEVFPSLINSKTCWKSSSMVRTQKQTPPSMLTFGD